MSKKLIECKRCGAEISKNRETLTWKDVTVPAGETIQKTFTVIVKDITESGTYVGVPARKIK